MMGVEAPETCWATHKRQVINLWNCCIWLVDLFELLLKHILQNQDMWVWTGFSWLGIASISGMSYENGNRQVMKCLSRWATVSFRRRALLRVVVPGGTWWPQLLMKIASPWIAPRIRSKDGTRWSTALAGLWGRASWGVLCRHSVARRPLG